MIFYHIISYHIILYTYIAVNKLSLLLPTDKTGAKGAFTESWA